MVPVILTTCVLVCLLTSTPSLGAKILFFPSNINSHFVYFGHLADALTQEGHETSLLLQSNAKAPKSLSPSVEVITYAVPAPIAYYSSPQCSALLVKAALSETFSEMMDAFLQLDYDMQASFGEECDALFQNDELVKQIEHANYDLIVVDTVSFTCGYTLPYKLGVPYISFSIPIMMWVMRVPALPSFVPTIWKDYTDRMTLWERMDNIFFQVLDYYYLNTTDHFIRTYVPEKPAVTPLELMQNSSLYFVLSDPTVSYPSPKMPNIMDMGDIMARPAQTLPNNLKRYMDVSKRGVILISFGSYIDHLPSEITCKFVKALSLLPYNAIWKVKEDSLECDIPSNVKALSWIPQNDLLGHPNIKLFMSHCGFNSFIEAVYHAVPVLACPLSLDQPFNAKVVETHGYGLKLDFKSFTVEDVINSVNTIITNATYKDSIRKASNILRDRPQSAAKRASFWINHVVKYGADHLRTNAMELSVTDFFMLDIFVFVSVMLIIVTVASLCCCRLIYKLCCAKVCRKTKSKSKHE